MQPDAGFRDMKSPHIIAESPSQPYICLPFIWYFLDTTCALLTIQPRFNKMAMNYGENVIETTQCMYRESESWIFVFCFGVNVSEPFASLNQHCLHISAYSPKTRLFLDDIQGIAYFHHYHHTQSVLISGCWIPALYILMMKVERPLLASLFQRNLRMLVPYKDRRSGLCFDLNFSNLSLGSTRRAQAGAPLTHPQLCSLIELWASILHS